MKYSFIKFRFLKFIQSGLYMDFFIKKISEIFVRNFFIYSSLFFGEKYFIEVLTKKIIDNSVFRSNKFFSIMDLTFSYYFIQLITLLFFVLAFVNLILLYI